MAGTLYRINNILVTREDSNGNILANPTLLKICPTDFSLKEEPKFDEKGCLLTDSKKMLKGVSEITGTVTVTMDAQSLPFIMTHVLGEKTSVADATTEAWAADTVYTQGTIVNHSDGIHSLYAVDVYGDGKSGSTEPSDSGRDNNIEWVMVNKLLKYEYEMQDTCPTFRVEYALTDGTNYFYKQFKGVEISQLPINIDGESTSYDLGLDFKGATAIDSEDSNWITNLTAVTGATVIEFDRDYYGGECELNTVKIDDALIENTDAISMTIDKQLGNKRQINCGNRLTRDLKVQGEITEEFTIDKYNKYKNQSEFNLKMELKTSSGASVLYEFPKVEGLQTDPTLTSRTEVMISPKLNALDDSATPVCKTTVVAPALVSDGALVGDGSY